MKKVTNHELVKKIEQHVKKWLLEHQEFGYKCERVGNSVKLVIGNGGPKVKKRGGYRVLNETQKTEIERLIAKITETFNVVIEKLSNLGTQVICRLCLPTQQAS